MCSACLTLSRQSKDRICAVAWDKQNKHATSEKVHIGCSSCEKWFLAVTAKSCVGLACLLGLSFLFPSKSVSAAD